MPVNIIYTFAVKGWEGIPFADSLKTYLPPLLVLGILKYIFSSTKNTWERELHGRVFLITGATSGLGQSVTEDLAKKGAQLVLLVRSTSDCFIQESVQELRERTKNNMIYIEECDLASLYSVRTFATRWLDNKPARRIDGIICCAAVSQPIHFPRNTTPDGIEIQTQVNFLAQYHLLNLLEPAFKAQPPDRDVRIILVTCVSNALADLNINDISWEKRKYPLNQPWKVYGASKLALSMYGIYLQKKLIDFKRPDNMPNNTHVIITNPGIMRSPSFTRFISFGSLWALLIYIITYPIWWLFLDNSFGGSQTVLNALMCPEYTSTNDNPTKSPVFLQNCQVIKPARNELKINETSEFLRNQLIEKSEILVLNYEKEGFKARKREEKLKSKKSSSSSGSTPKSSTPKSTEKSSSKSTSKSTSK